MESETAIFTLADEQVAALNKKLNKKFAIQMVGQAVVATALVVGLHLLGNKLDSEADDIQE